MERPMGVTLLAILNAVFGMLFVLAGLSFFMYKPLYVELIRTRMAHMPMPISEKELLAFLNVFAISSIIGGIIGILVAFGLWMGFRWAWWVYMVLLGLNLISAFLSLPQGIIGIAIVLIIMFYMTRPHVRRYFNV